MRWTYATISGVALLVVALGLAFAAIAALARFVTR